MIHSGLRLVKILHYSVMDVSGSCWQVLMKMAKRDTLKCDTFSPSDQTALTLNLSNFTLD